MFTFLWCISPTTRSVQSGEKPAGWLSVTPTAWGSHPVQSLPPCARAGLCSHQNAEVKAWHVTSNMRSSKPGFWHRLTFPSPPDPSLSSLTALDWAALWTGPDGEELTCCQPCEWAGAWFFSPSRRLQPWQQLDPWKALNWNDSDKLLLGFLLLETVWDHLFYPAKFWSNIDNWYREDQWFIVCSSSTNISVNCLQIAVYNW